MLRDLDNDPGYYAAVSSTDPKWKGATLFVSTDGGTTYASVGSSTVNATAGVTSDALGACSNMGIPDERRTVNVVLHHGTLSSVSFDAFLSGSQAALIGDEIVYFRNAVLELNGSYTLSGFMRGRRGSGYAAGSHYVGDRFILLTANALRRVPDTTSNIGVSRHYKAVTYGATVVGSTAYTFTNRAAGLRPYAPAHLGGGLEADGSFTLKWVRRSRVSGEWRDSVDVPLSEESEHYAVEIFSSDFSVQKRTIDCFAQSCSYSAAQQVEDFGSTQSTIYFRVYQLSAVVGRGYGSQGTCPATSTTELAYGAL